jgi:putrescine transport system ATP-binding protein
VLLLDEPLSALDRKLREETRFELMELQQRLGLTFVMVTHDQDEAMAMSDRIGVMHQGQLAQVATPSEIYEQPNSRWVADFVGDVNLIEGQLCESGPDGAVIESNAGGWLRIAQPVDAPPGTVLWVAVRPEKIQVTRAALAATGDNCFGGVIVDVGYLGDLSIYKVKLDNGLILKASAANRTPLAGSPFGRGDRVWLTWPGSACVALMQ